MHGATSGNAATGRESAAGSTRNTPRAPTERCSTVPPQPPEPRPPPPGALTPSIRQVGQDAEERQGDEHRDLVGLGLVVEVPGAVEPNATSTLNVMLENPMAMWRRSAMPLRRWSEDSATQERYRRATRTARAAGLSRRPMRSKSPSTRSSSSSTGISRWAASMARRSSRRRSRRVYGPYPPSRSRARCTWSPSGSHRSRNDRARAVREAA